MRTALLLALTCVTTDALGYAYPPPRDYQPAFDLNGHVPATTARASAFAPGGRIAAAGDGALAIDGDSGQLVLADRDGKRVAALALGGEPGLLVMDAGARRAYVADRAHDRVLAIDVRGKALAVAAKLATPREPYGLALAPDARTLLVTSIAEHVLVAYDVTTGGELWRTSVDREPRAVAIAPDGKHAIVTHLASGGVELVDLASHRTVTRPLRHDLSPACTSHRGDKSTLQCPDPDATSFARGAFAAVFLGNDVAAVAFQRESPVPRPQFAAAHLYGGSAVPITRHVAFVGLGGAQAVAQIGAAEPRALAYDASHDLLYVAGMGNDVVSAIEHATSSPEWGDTIQLADDHQPCGVDGLAIAADGGVLAWCSFTRSIVRAHVETAPPKTIPRYTVELARDPELAPTHFTPVQHDGFVRFHHESTAIARFERAACASCHLDGRSDGLAWQIEDHRLRTPVLAGRVVDTAPYKWTGHDADLDASVVSTIDRLGGYAGSDRGDHDLKGPDPLVAYLESLAPVRAPPRPADAVARGRELFESADLGCASCHAGPETTDHARHVFDGSPLELDTPSLHGLTAAPRYLHDGSAATLDDVLQERGSIKGMIARPLSASERADLIAYLESL
ncbi:MAG: c-type cytochrome [Acidobacteriota bacterium]